MTAQSSSRRHEMCLSVTYGSERRARIIADALDPELGRVDDDRSNASLARDGAVVHIRVAAADLVALRAGTNSWSRLLEVAERVSR